MPGSTPLAPENSRQATPSTRRGLTSRVRATAGARALVLGLALKVLAVLVTAIGLVNAGLISIVDAVGSVAVAFGGAYFLWLGIRAARRRLLWRVRRKLIISYIFIGFIPALLIIAFFLLGGFLLFSNFSSYLVQNRLREMGEHALAVADATALEARLADGRDLRGILARRQQALAGETSSASIALVPMEAACGDVAARRSSGRRRLTVLSAGPWAHLDAPHDVPEWISCDGFAGLLAYREAAAAAPTDGSGASGSNDRPVRFFVRAVALPQGVPSGYAAVIDLPIDASVRATLREGTSVDIASITLLSGSEHVPDGRATPADTHADAGMSSGIPQPAVSFLSHRDWETGGTGTAQVRMQLNIGRLFRRLVEAQGSVEGVSLGQGYVFVLLFVWALLFVIQAIAVAMGLALARSITGSVHELFVGTVKVQQGDFRHRISVTARDQLGALAESFNSMTASIENLLREAAEKKRLEEELRIAHEIQMSLLPQAPASVPGLSITALCVPAREVGGDYYDFLPLEDGRLGCLIADVAGKGTSAALYMAELKGLMLSLSRTYSSPRELLIMANRLIAAHLDARSFITMTYAVIDQHQRTLTYARAGHTPLLYLPGPASLPAGVPKDAGGNNVQLLAPDGLVLGLKIDDGTLFERLLVEQTIPLRTGDIFLLFTDGLSEAMNAQDDCFGEQRLGEFLAAHGHLPCAELRERMVREVETFVGEAPQHDDMTMILLKVDALPEAGDQPGAAGQVALVETVHS